MDAVGSVRTTHVLAGLVLELRSVHLLPRHIHLVDHQVPLELHYIVEDARGRLVRVGAAV